MKLTVELTSKQREKITFHYIFVKQAMDKLNHDVWIAKQEKNDPTELQKRIGVYLSYINGMQAVLLTFGWMLFDGSIIDAGLHRDTEEFGFMYDRRSKQSNTGDDYNQECARAWIDGAISVIKHLPVKLVIIDGETNIQLTD